MNPRFLRTAFAAVLLPAALAACGSDDDSEGNPAPRLSGVYRPVDEGPIGTISFSGSKDYRLVPSGCAAEACTESGHYSLDDGGRTLVLENAVSRQARTLTLEIVTTTTGASLTKSVKPLELVKRDQELNKPGGSQLNDGRGKELNDGAENQLNDGSGNQLNVVSRALIDGQQMQRDN